MFSLPRPFARVTWLMACIVSVFMATPLSAQTQISPAQKTPHYDFGPNDYIRARIKDGMKKDYFVGEPVILPIVLSNHTQFPITIESNFNPRGDLHLIIRTEGKPSEVYHGPYPIGIYPPLHIFLLPLEEHTDEVVLWGDLDTPNGLAFPEPGDYTIEVSQQIRVQENTFQQELAIGTVAIHVAPTPKAFEPVVAQLKTDEAAGWLQRMKTPPDWSLEKMEQVVRSTPPSSISPYLYLAFADQLQLAWDKEKAPAQKKKYADAALGYYQLAAKSDSAYKLDAYSALLKFMDRLDVNSQMTAGIARAFVDALPRDRRGKVGSSQLLEKYLINTQELDRVKMWTLFP